jgi:hypothetical protein
MDTECVKQEDVYNQGGQEAIVEITDSQPALSQITGAAIPGWAKWTAGTAAVGGVAGAALGAGFDKNNRPGGAAMGGVAGAVVGATAGFVASGVR